MAVLKGLLVLALLVGSAGAATLTVPGDYATIQDAINAATATDTILVNSGTYYEHVNVDKRLTLRGVDTGGGLPIVDALRSGSAIKLTADGCTLEGFVAQNVSASLNAGIMVTSDGNTISGNTATGNNYGIFLSSSSNNTISGNTATGNNDNGIFLYSYSNNNDIFGNTVTGNNYIGIVLDSSCNNNDIFGNIVTGNNHGIFLHYSSGNIIFDNNVTRSNQNGIDLRGSSGNIIFDNNVTRSNQNGIFLSSYSNNNDIFGNTVTGNNYLGISLDYSSGNIIYLNNFNNNHNAYSGSANDWNATTSVTWEHEDRNLTGLLGNIWSDYDGIDCDGDGIGDTPYLIPGGSDKDYHPIGGRAAGPAIEVEKIANRTEAGIGEMINYTIWVNNTGNVTLTGVWAEDNLTGTVWDLGTLEPGQNRTNSTSYLVKETDLPGPVTNELRANGTDPCGFEVNDSAIETVSILYDPRIEVEKTSNLSFGAPSTTIEFTINVTNTGNVNLSYVNLTDYLPAGLEYVSDDQTTRTIDGDNVTWNLGPLNRTDTRTIELVAHIDGTVFGPLKNRAEAAGTAPLGDEVTDGDEAEVEALKAEIEVEKTGEVDYGPASTNATFTIKVENAGNITLTEVEVVDVLPAGLFYLSSIPAGTEVGKTITWPNIGPLAEAGTAEIKIFTRVDGAASGSLTNEVTVTGTPEHGKNVTDEDNATVMATLDFGDAPDPSYPTLLASDGARHIIVPGFMLGSEIDGEHDGQPTAAADGDDVAGVDDEDGVAFTTYLVPGGFANVEVEASASGNLDAWIDFDDDGSWTASDQIFNSEPIALGTNHLQFAVPETAAQDVETFARFRFSSAGGLSPSGLADDGEVEDCTVEILKDSDGDGAPDLLEGQGDRDGDGIPNHLDYDPSGYLYNESDAQIITGGKISVTGPGNVTIKKDGSDGRYEFWTDGTPGVYELKLTFPAGYILSPTCSPGGTFDPTGRQDDPVYLGSDENRDTGYLVSNLCLDNPYYLRFDLETGDPFVMANNIPLARLNSIGDLVWNDLDGDGCQDEDEAGVTGVPVALLDENGSKVDETTTGPGGLYLFSDLPPGGYRLQFDAPPGCSFCPCHQCDECLDSDADPATGLTDLIVLETNENEMTIDAGLHTSLNVSKTVDKKNAKRGEELTYTIRICNLGSLPAKNVVVEDVFDKSVEFVSADPAPGADGLWRFDEIPAGECVEIVLVVRVPKQDLEFEMAQGVSGRGFVNVANDYSTTLSPYVINNRVKVTSGAVVATDSESVSISGEPGTELETREHGSGLYDGEEQVRLRTENKSISMEKDVSATYTPTTLGLYRNRTATYSSKWTEEARAKNRITGASMSESYRRATSIDRASRFFLDENESAMEIEAEFDGMGHFGFLKKSDPEDLAQSVPTFESREDYVGSFKVVERIDEYGSAVSSEKAASGEGLVVVDKRVGDVQRSYESGSGSYDSEEIVETSTNYIAKDISLVYAPTSQTLTDDVAINSSMKWKEGMRSKNPRASYIGEEYTSITELDKETVARGLNDMATDADFSGRARFRAVLERNVGDPEVNFDEEYDGDYSVERRVIFTGVAKYSTPHLNVTKTMVGNVTEETLPWDRDEVHLAGEVKTRKVANYVIAIENDGNKALGPVYVQDLFPPGSAFIEASLRPSELTDSYANWTLLNLGIGDVVNINLKMDVTGYHPSELVNRVEVCGGINNGDEWVCVSNFSALEVDWLTCCPNETVSVTKTAKLDPVNDSVVRYRVEIRNVEDATRVATVTDRLPAGMELIGSSIPFASYEEGVVVWNLIEIKPFETVTIEFSALARGFGRFTNTIEVDPRSVDGLVVQPVRATCVIDVGTVEDECGPVSCDVWQPPNWEFEYVGYPTEMTCEEN